MADNILKNEFMWEEKKAKKKLYKNWKLYASVLGIIVIGAGTGLGIYYGINGNHSEITKIALSTLNQDAINSTSLNISNEEAFNAFKNNNKDKNLDINNFDITITKQPGYDSDNGSFTITAKTNTEYNGTITITINGLKSTALSTLNQDAINSTSLNISNEEAFNAFKNNNKDKNLDINNFDITITKQPGYDSDNGSFTITAKTNTEYNGTITITINGLKSTALIDKIRQIHSEGITKHSEEEWKNAWNDYFNFEKSQIPNFIFSLTDQDLNNELDLFDSLARQIEDINHKQLGEDLSNSYRSLGASINGTAIILKESQTIKINNAAITILLNRLDNDSTQNSWLIQMNFTDVIKYTKI